MASNWTERRVVVTGIGVVTALGTSPREFWENILAGKCGVRPITCFDASAFTTRIAAEILDFDASAAFPSPKDARRTDRYGQLAVFAGHQALLDSGLDLNKVNRDEVGVFLGSGIGGLHTMAEQHAILMTKGPGRLSPFMIPMLNLNMGSGLFSMYHAF